jgi:hypothetical protein
MLPRYRNFALAREHALKLSSGEVPIASYIYVRRTEAIEDPENMYIAADMAGLKKKMIYYLKDFGFPGSAIQRRDIPSIDSGLAAVLYDHLQIKYSVLKGSEAADLRVWAFFNICIIPEIIEWRYKKSDSINADRFIGIRRNYGGYLWIAAWLFCDSSVSDKWHVLKRMSVDSIVQIVERPGVGYNSDFALALGKQLTKTIKIVKTNEMDLMRGAMLRARFTGAVIKLTNDKQINEQLANHLISWSRKYYVKTV